VSMELAGSFLIQVKELRPAQQSAILQALMPWIEQTERLATGSSTLSEVREARFAEGLRCPRCQCTSVKRNGMAKDKKGLVKQRYVCHGCGRAFNDLTGTPLAYSKKQELWGQMARCMVEGRSIRKTAQTLDVHVATAFAWRHKLLSAHRDLEKPTLTGIVETDEMYFLHSMKGSRGVGETGRKPRRRGGVATKRGLSKEQVCLVVAQDRNQQSLAEVSGMGMPSVTDVRQVLTHMVHKEATFALTGHRRTGGTAKRQRSSTSP
jgi:transposase-like protein